MKMPANRFTIHDIEANYVVQHVAAPRPSIWVRARWYLAQGLVRAKRGLVQSGRVAWFVVTQLFRIIVGAGVGSVHGVRFLYHIALTWLLFVFINVPLLLIALCFLMFTIACGWDILDALYRGWLHLPRL
jgi:hypothetical protein